MNITYPKRTRLVSFLRRVLKPHFSSGAARWSSDVLGGHRLALGAAAAGAIFLGVSSQSSAATIYTWGNTSNDWNDPNSWAPNTGTPSASGDSAIFGAAGNAAFRNPTNGAVITIGNATFTAAAPQYVGITNTAAGTITFDGTGIVNSSAFNQIVNNNGGLLDFINSSAAGTNMTINNGAAGAIFFENLSTSESAAINNTGAGASILFFDSSNAGTSVITLSDATSQLTFSTSSRAASATIVNNGAGATPATSSNVGFTGASTAENATIVNLGANTRTFFTSNAGPGFITTAANATITNQGAGSTTLFDGNATAGQSRITNSGAGSFTQITQSLGAGFVSTGGNATIINTGAGSFIQIDNTGSGGNAALVNANPTAFIDISQLTNSGTTAGSIAGNGSLFLGSKNLTVGSNNTNTTFSGIIQNGGPGGGVGGSLTKVGLGVLTLSGANTYTGNTTINAGGLIINGSIVSPTTLVNHGGLLGGSGVIGGNVTNHGIVEPASTTAGLTVKGNYTQASDGNLRIDVGSNSTFGKLTVNGVATLAGGLTAVVAPGVKQKAGVSFRFLTASGGVNGRFDTLDSNLPSTGTIVKLGLKYDANSVYLQFLQGSFAALNGLTYNQTAVAKALDRVAFDSREKRLIGYLDNQSLAKLPHDFDLIAPEELSAVWASSFALANVQNANIQRRTDDIRNGSSGFSAAGLAMNGSSQSYSGPLQFRTGSAGPTGDGKESKEVYNPAPDNKWGVFLSGTGEWVNVGDTDNARGYNIDTGGFTLGLDYKITPNFAVGINAGYAGTGVNLTDGGRIFVNGGKLGVYATYFTGGFYADASASGGYNSYDIRRHGLGGTVRGDTDGGEFNALFGTGYDFVFGGLKIGPTATFQYSYLGLSDFQEKGSLAPLAVNSQSHDSIRTAFGLRAIYDWKVGGVIIRPEVRAAWQHEYGDRAYAVDSHFATGAGSDFSVDGPEMGRDSLLISAGLAILWNERTSTFLYYDGQVAGTNYDSHSITGGVRVAY